MKYKYLQNRKKYFQTYLSTLLLLIFSWSIVSATACDELKVTTTNTAIQVSNITAPKAIIKIFDSNWKEQAVCNDNCGTEIEFSALKAGEFHVQIQLFDTDWEGLCKTTIDIFVERCFCPQVYMPVCGIDGKTYGNACEAACAGVEIAADGECTSITTCDLLTRIRLPNTLCDQGLTEIAVYELAGKSYLVYIADNALLADGQTRVVDCDTGEEFCVIGGIIGATCDNFLEKAEKLETIVQEDCRGCICTKEYAPVCGVDGKTYGNRCEADCAGVDIISEGECASPVTTCDLLARILLPNNLCDQGLTEIAVYSLERKSYLVYLADNILLTDGLTSILDCDTGEEFCVVGGIGGASCDNFFDKAEKLETIVQENCGDCICTREYAPVCGADGRTYGNRCEADCAGVDIIAEGECEPCACDDNYAPVCGVDGNTYSNRCMADCAGVDIILEGECAPVTTCDLLARITFNTDLCSQCLSEIAVYSFNGKSYLVYIGDNIICADVPNSVIDCETGAPYCNDGGGELMSTCGDFFNVAEKIEVILKEDCTPCFCTEEYAPVCGIDGKTYDNRCKADCAGVDIFEEGECPCICPAVALPVCGVDGKTYINACKAACAGVEVAFDESCEECIGTPLLETICRQEYNPVCGCNDITYINECAATVAGVKSWTLGACPDPDDCIGTPLEDIACAQVYEPVCGCNNITYGNSCEAEVAGVKSWITGLCPEDCVGEQVDLACDQEYEPVCGCNNITYSNSCEAEVAGVKSWVTGACPDPNDCFGLPDPLIKCDGEYEPVCGCDGKTYQNACTAGQTGILSITEGPCPVDCACPENYDPVCGVDGKTYGNECEAKCAGVEIASEGECTIDEGCDILSIILFSDDICGTCTDEIAVYNYNGKNYLVYLGDFLNCPDAVTRVSSCAFGGGNFCEEGGDNTGTPCGDFFEKAIKLNTILKADCADDCQGFPTPGVPCEEAFQPVCACNGQTYANQCTAQSLGLKSWTEGVCDFTTIECGDINIAYNKQTIRMSGASNTSYFFKIHDINNDYFEVFNCTENCGSGQSATLPSGQYAVKIYDTEWALICEQPVTLVDESVPNNGIFRCEDAMVTYKNGTVKLVGDEDKSYHMKVIDANYKDAFACMWECGSTITAENIPTGKYLVRIFDEDYQELCEESIYMSTSNDLTIRENNSVAVAAYPNPAQTEFFLRINKSITKGNGTLQVINAFGQIMNTQTLTNKYDETIRLDVSDYQNGLYFYQVKLPNQQLTSGKLLVNRLY